MAACNDCTTQEQTGFDMSPEFVHLTHWKAAMYYFAYKSTAHQTQRSYLGLLDQNTESLPNGLPSLGMAPGALRYDHNSPEPQHGLMPDRLGDVGYK